MVLSCGQYKTMDSAPVDGTVVLVLTESKHPFAAYYDVGAGEWRYWQFDNDCYPQYWAELPAEVPAGFREIEVENDRALKVQYAPIATAPLTADDILVLVDPEEYPIAAYYDEGWKASVDDAAVVPVYWIPMPPLPVDYPA